MSAAAYRYELPRKALKTSCPACGHRSGKTLSRYVDTQTGDPLPLPYGRCDRESNCGYHLSPYHQGGSGLSYADEQRTPTLPKDWFRWAGQQKWRGVSRRNLVDTLILTKGATSEQAERVAVFIYDNPRSADMAGQFATLPTERVVYTLPEEVFQASLGHYEHNQFAHLLRVHFGVGVAKDLLSRFQIGTSTYWPGACVFWYVDEQGRKRGGQIKLFDDAFHTARYVDYRGQQRSKTSWVHTALTRRYRDQQIVIPDWLTAYNQYGEPSPCLFGLSQLLTASIDQPVGLVEAPKTAGLCTPYFPQITWMAVGALSYLNAKRLAPLRDKGIVLFPDLSTDGSAFARWQSVADTLRGQGFCIRVSDYLEKRATDAQRKAGLDIADYLLGQWPGYPPDWDL